MDTTVPLKNITITLIRKNKDGVPVEKTTTYPDGREVTESLI